MEYISGQEQLSNQQFFTNLVHILRKKKSLHSKELNQHRLCITLHPKETKKSVQAVCTWNIVSVIKNLYKIIDTKIK